MIRDVHIRSFKGLPPLFSISISWTERSALRALWEKLFVHKSDLMNAFREFDPNNTGTRKKQTNQPTQQLYRELIHTQFLM